MQITLDEYRAQLALNKRARRVADNADKYGDLDDYDKHQYKRLSLLRHHARKANLQVAKVSGYNVYTLITNDGLAMTFENLDDAFDFAHRYHLVKTNFLD